MTAAAPSLGERLASGAFDIAAGAVTMLILLYFLLAAGDLFLRKLIKVLPSVEDKKRAAEIARQIETEISTYLSTVTFPLEHFQGFGTWMRPSDP